MIRQLMCLTLLAGTVAMAADSPPIPMNKADRDMRKTIGELRHAVQVRDAQAVYSRLAPDYYVLRDFDGSYNPAATPVQNFSLDFEFDDAKLRPEYQGHGWKKFGQALAGSQFEVKRTGHWCLPHGAQDRRPVPHAQLCFRKYAMGWRIQGYIRGGD